MDRLDVKGKTVLVDPDIYERARHHTWWFTDKGYVVTSVRLAGKNHRVWLHRVAKGTQCLDTGRQLDPATVDHEKGDKLDCRRSSLRKANQQQQILNRDMPVGASGYIGVTQVKKTGKWAAKFLSTHLGTFGTAKEAAMVRDAAVKATLPAADLAFARLNFVGA